MAERSMTIRLSVTDSEVVRRALEALGADGQRSLERITRAVEKVNPGLQSLNEITEAGRGVLEGYAGRAGAVGGALSRLGPAGLAGAAAIGAVSAALGVGLHEFAMAEQSSLRLEAVFRATGNAAGVTADEIGELADELEASTMASAEAIKEAAAVLATFRNVSGEAFTEALRLAQDMAATFGGDAREKAMQLGKALQDPVEGVTALRRSGVSLSEQQRQMIADFMAVGDVASAQKVILAEVRKEVGGAGEGEAGGLTGATKHLHDAWGNLLEEFTKTSGAGQGATSFMKWLTSLVQGATRAVADLPLDAKIAETEARVARLRELAESYQPSVVDKALGSEDMIRKRRWAEVAKAEDELGQLRARKAEDRARQDEAASGAADHRAEMAGEAQRARVKALEEDVLKSAADAAVKRRAVEAQLTRDLAAEEAKRGKPGIDDASVDRAATLLRQRAAQQIDEIERPAREAADRAAKQLADDQASFQGVVDDLRRQVLKVEDARASFIDQAVGRIPETLRGREELVETVRREAAETYDLIAALKALDDIESTVAENRRSMAEEGRRLYESLRTPAEKYADEIARIAELQAAGAITAETGARAVAKADSDMAGAGTDAFADLKQSVEGWGRQSARVIAQSMASGKMSLRDFGDFANRIFEEVLEKLLMKSVTGPAVDALSSGLGLAGGGGLFGWLGSQFKGGGASAAANPGSDGLPGFSEAFASWFHGGGEVAKGRDYRPVDPAWFDAAPRYHSGKGPRLQPGEVPAVLLETEEVLTESDPRHSRNGGGRMAFAPVINIPFTLNASTPPGTAVKSAGMRRDSSGGFTLDLLVEKVEEAMGNHIRRGQGLAPVIEDQYGLNRANGSYG